MTPSGRKSERQILEQAIAVQESLRGTIDDAIVDAAIATLKEKLTSLEPPPQQQRKLASILFMDIAGHTGLTINLDPEEQMAIVDPAIARMAGKVNEFGGRVARFQGDGFKAVFGLPVGHENDPENAIKAGLAIQAEAVEIAEELNIQLGLSGFQVRVGITTGMVFAGGETEGEDTIKGPPVNLAARLESAAEPGTILISRDTYAHVRGIFDMEALNPIQAKGFSDPVPVFRVLRAKSRSFYRGGRGVEGIETRMVGREGEMRVLQDAYELAHQDREIQGVTLVGDAGLGKTRLLYEFENWVNLQPGSTRLFRSRAAQASQGLPYGLLRNLLAFRFKILDDDTSHDVEEKLRLGLAEGLQEYGDLEMKTHFIGRLLGYILEDSPHLVAVHDDPQQLRDRAVKYLVEFFQNISPHNLVMLLLEDIHWADDSSLDVVNELLSRLRKRAVLLVSATRPTLYKRRVHWGEGLYFHTRVDLRPLSKLASRQLVGQILQKVMDLPDSMRDLVVENAEGNPFYLEELVKMLVEQGAIEKGEDQWRVVSAQLDRVQVPQTLTGVLQARLDRLAREERLLLQQASVVGRTFWDLLLVALQEAEEGELGHAKVLEGLQSLRRREMVYRREASAFGEAVEHIFKHDLLREVTYESVLLTLRRRYHSLAADWLIENSRPQQRVFIGLIAEHLVQAERSNEAFLFLQQAGKEAAAAYAQEEAVAAFSQALELASEGDLETRWELLSAREKANDFLGRREGQKADLVAMAQIGLAIQDRGKQATAALRSANYEEVIGNYARVIEVSRQAIGFASSIGDKKQEGRGYYYLGRAHFQKGEDNEAQAPMKRALELARESKDRRREGHTLRMLGNLTTWNKKEWKKKETYYEKALIIAREISDRRGELMVINNLGVAAMERGNLIEALKFYQEAHSIAREIGDRQAERLNFNNRGFTEIGLGNYSQAIKNLLHSCEIAREIDERSGELYGLTNLGGVTKIIGNYVKAENYFEKALVIALEINDRIMEGRNYLHLGFIAEVGNDLSKAKEYYNKAHTIAQDIGKVSLEAAALDGLSNVLIGQGKPDQAVKYALAAITLWEGIIWEHVLIDSRAGLVRALHAKGENSLATEEVEIILAYMDEGGALDVTEYPVRIYLTCYAVLKASGNERADEMLSAGHKLLMERAAKITDEADRRSYLNKVPWHIEILKLWESQQEM